MGRLIVSENISLDGVIDDATGEDGSPRAGWFDRSMGGDRAAWAAVELDEAHEASALLHGRRTDAFFGSRWNDMPGEWADRLRSLPKHVVSSTIDEPVWVNSTVLRGDVVEAVRGLKDAVDGVIVVYGSRTLVRALLAHGLVDEVRLILFPIVVGSGPRLLDGLPDERSASLRSSERVGDGLVRLVYDLVRSPTP